MSAHILKTLALAVFAVGIGTGIYANQTNKPITFYSPTPGGCSSPAGCYAYCQQNAEECGRYCAIDSSHAAECASWLDAVRVSISTEGMPAGSYTPPAGDSGSSYTPPAGSGTSYTPPAGDTGSYTYTPPAGDSGSSYTPPSTGSYTPPAGSGSSYPSPTMSPEEGCRQTPNCTWTGTYCQCGGTGTSYPGTSPGTSPGTNPYDPATRPTNSADCAARGYTWCDVGGYTRCDIERSGCGGSGATAPTTGQTPGQAPTAPATAPQPQPVGCFYQQPSPSTVALCTSAVDAYIRCDATATRYTSRAQMIKNCTGYEPTPAAACPAITCLAPQISCDLAGDGNPCPVCSTQTACSVAGRTISPPDGTATSPATPAPTTPSLAPPPGCAFRQPSVPNIDTCTTVTDNYLACYPTAARYTSRRQLIADCANAQNVPTAAECAPTRCSLFEISCNPQNDNNPCAVCMAPQACREATEGAPAAKRPQPETPRLAEPERLRQPEPTLAPPATAFARPPCGDDPAKCASYCANGGQEAAKLCSGYCLESAHQDECRGWGEAYVRLRGGTVGRPSEEHPPEEDDARRLDDMKKGFKSWLREFRNIERRVSSLRGKKISIPAEIAAALETVKMMQSKIDAAASVEELRELGQDLQDTVQTINEALPSLERLAEFSRVQRDIDRQLRAVESRWRQLERRSRQIANQTTLPGQIAQQIAEARQNRAAAVAAAGESKADEAFDLVEAVFTGLDEAQEKMNAVDLIVSSSRELARARRELSGFARTLRELQRRGLDVAETREILNKLSALLAEIAKLAAQKPFPVDDVIAARQAYEDVKDDFILTLDELRGAKREVVPAPASGPVPLQLPKGFEGSVAPPTGIFGPAT